MTNGDLPCNNLRGKSTDGFLLEILFSFLAQFNQYAVRMFGMKEAD
jgi:hypothetical protein